MNLKSLSTIVVLALLAIGSAHAQNKLYPNEFPLKDVTLLDGPFKHGGLAEPDKRRCR